MLIPAASANLRDTISAYRGSNRMAAALEKGEAQVQTPRGIEPQSFDRFGSIKNNRRIYYNADGDSAELDEKRIRRTREKTEIAEPSEKPPESLEKALDYMKRRVIYYSADGDSAEFSIEFRLPEKSETPKAVGQTEGAEKTGECQTCDSRKYVDRSDDPSVSYQTPTKLNPSTAAAAIAAHENEHVVNERKDAEKEGRRIISQTVTIKYATCPECGVTYPSGGTTRTLSDKAPETEQEKNKNADENASETEGSDFPNKT